MARTPHTDDGALARAHLAGEPGAFDVLYRRYHPDLVEYLHRRVHDRVLAEDLAQDTLTRALKYLRSYDTGKPMWPWLSRIAVHLAEDDARKRRFEVPVCDVSEHDRASDDDLTDRLFVQDIVARLLARLPSKQRRALEMRYLEDRTPAEIAQVLKVTRNALEQLLWRARGNLKREYVALDPTPLRHAGLLGLPLLGRFRRLLAEAHARLQPFADTGLTFASNAAVAAALVTGGATAVGGLADFVGRTGGSHWTAAPAARIAVEPVAAPDPRAAPAPAATRAPRPGVTPSAEPTTTGSSGMAAGTEAGPVKASASFAPDPTAEGPTDEEHLEVGPIKVEVGGENKPGPDAVCSYTGYHCR